jgi:F-type H+-transporting ATPase subunit delta
MALNESGQTAISKVYAKSLFQLALAKGGNDLVQATLDELQALLDLAKSMPKFSEFLSSPLIGAGNRGTSIDHIFAGRISDLTLRFLKVLNRKGRLAALPQIVTSLDALTQEKLGRVEVDVFTAEPLEESAKATLREKLGRSLQKEVILHPYLDSAMIGGVKLRIGDQLLDGSIATQLRNLREKVEVIGASKLRAKMADVLG